MDFLVRNVVAAAALTATLALPASADAGTQYQYDALGRLTRVAYETGVIVQYSYDAVGNRTQVVVSGINRPPVAVNDSANVTASAAVDIMVRANDSDPDGDNLTVTAVGTPTGGGTVAIQGGGTHVRYTAPATTGAKSFTYMVSDGRGGTDTATVTVNVGVANRAPVAVNDSASVNASTSVDIMVRANDSDPDGDPLTVTAVGTPSGGGAATIEGGGAYVRYTAPATGGVKSFSYTISDGRGGTASATVSVNVVAVNRPPVAVNDQLRIEAFKSANVYVIGNDSDPDGDPLTITNVSGSGASIGGSRGYIAYNAGGIGLKTVHYTISDGRGGTASATLTVDVYRIFPGDPPPELQAPDTSAAAPDMPATSSED